MFHPQVITRSAVTTVMGALAAGALALPVQVAVADSGSVTDEIIVTAQRREQNVQDVGIAITTFSADQMRQLGFTDAIDVVAQTPGLSVARPGAGAINIFSIRGVTQADYGPNQEAPVALYLDEAYISQNTVSNFSLYDLERVEVLRGPQGTLFGRNATGGLVHYLTRKPSQDFEATVEGQLGSSGRQRLEGAIGGGLAGSVSGRLSGVLNQSDGLMENDIGLDGQAADDYSVRGQLLFEPSEDLDILLKAQYSEDDSDRGNYFHETGENGAFTPPPATDFFGYRDADGDPWTGSWDFPGFNKAEVTQFTGRADWELGAVTLTWVGDYQDIEHDYGEDSDVSPANVFNYTQMSDVQQWSQELRASWDGDGVRVVGGVYLLDIDGDYVRDSLVFGQEDVDWSDLFYGIPEPGGYRLADSFAQDTKTWAVFGQTEFDLTDTLTLIAGARWTEDDKDYEFEQAWLGADGLYVFFEGASPGDVPYFAYQDSFDEGDWSGRIQLNYQPTDDMLWYGSINRGIKSGGFNSPVDATGLLAVNIDEQFIPFDQNDDVMTYDGEVLTAYEVGLKSTWLEGRTRLNAAAYYYDYSDYQISNFVGVTQTVFNTDGTLWGGEVEVAASPIDGLDLMLGVSLLDSEVDLPAGIRPDGALTSDAVLAPELTWNGLMRYSWTAFGDGSMAAQGDFAWRANQIFNLSNTEVVREDSYAVVNLSLGYTSGSDRYFATVFVRNLLDEEYREYAFDTTGDFGSIEGVAGLERWYGMTAGVRWR